MSADGAARVLIVDDSRSIHADFTKVLTRESDSTEVNALQRAIFGNNGQAAAPRICYELTSAYQGREALERVESALASGQRYALAFVDMRMPPGWDGVQTIEALWSVDPDLQVVICSAYSEYDADEVLERLKQPDKLLVIKKPFEAVEILQCANALSKKWQNERALRQHLNSLEDAVRARTATLAQVNEQLREQMRLREAAEIELRLAQKLEAVGRLAAGIAHEINTPIQYISDSIHFLGGAFNDLLAAVAPQDPAVVVGEEDLQFLREEVPLAVERTIEGTQRVAQIVRAMKEFAHPDGGEKAAANLNRALETTLLIARNEYKYVATAELLPGEIPDVVCNLGELSQVFLNMIVNSAHALADAGRTADTGRIAVRTSVQDGWVEIQFEDNGCGIPAAIVDRIYDPFFTTKEVGRGTGQGLALARSIIVDKHGGRIMVDSWPGRGTCFTVRLPVGSEACEAV